MRLSDDPLPKHTYTFKAHREATEPVHNKPMKHTTSAYILTVTDRAASKNKLISKRKLKSQPRNQSLLHKLKVKPGPSQKF